MDLFSKIFRIPIVVHILFWLAVYSFYIVSGRAYSGFTGQLFLNKFLNLTLQIITAYSVIHFIIPRYNQKKNKLEFLFLFLCLLIGMNVLFVVQELVLLSPDKESCFSVFINEYSDLPLLTQIYEFKINFIFLSWLYVQPLMFLLALLYYRKQQKLAEVNEQKKIAELAALKHQLNPHFLFNTLNNLYSLTVDKSDLAPEIIERLSEILDYMLYRCNEDYVSISKEIELIENYLALEKVRYGKRANISFLNDLKQEVKIAPLILLTFVENAFKHGVSQELKAAKVDISLMMEGENIVFSVYNTKPLSKTLKAKKSVGLNNIRLQLDLLYADQYTIRVDEREESYFVELRLRSR